MRKLVLSMIGSAALAFSATAANAATEFAGTATGCFGPSSCTPLTTDSDAGLSYTSGTFDVFTDSNGHLSLGALGNNLGSFSLSDLVNDYNGDMFNLLVTFSLPAGAGPSTFTANLVGQVTGLPGGGVTIDFDNTDQLFAYDGGSFLFGVNDVDLTPGGPLQVLSGHIQAQAVPEPATWALMLLGFGGIGLALRVRRKPVLEQLA